MPTDSRHITHDVLKSIDKHVFVLQNNLQAICYNLPVLQLAPISPSYFSILILTKKTSFYAYVRSKQKVQDKVGPLEDSDGNIITEGFLMAENLNEYFSSVFTREDISALPVPETKFEGRESDYLGQLIVTPKMVAKKITDMKDNKSPGVDGIPPKITTGNCRTN